MQSTSKPNESLEELLKKFHEMQYSAMAHAHSGQPLPDEFSKEFAELEKQIEKAKEQNASEAG